MVKHMRPLYFHEGALYCSSFNTLFRTSDFGLTFSEIGKIALPRPLSLLRFSALAQRVLRASVYRLRVLPNGNIVFTFKGGVYTLRQGETQAFLSFPVSRGSRPVSLACSPDGVVAFGEYFSNPERTSVRIFGSDDFGLTWREVHKFNAGEIRHIHGVSYDRWARCFWICTGDYGNECRLIRASSDLRTFEVVRSGGQMNRFYSTLPIGAGLVVATDTPLQQNHIGLVNRADGSLQDLGKIENSNFYSCVVGDRVFVSTNAEPSPVNDVRNFHVWMGSVRAPEQPWRKIISWPVDFATRVSRFPGVPEALFQYPRFFFPEGENPGSFLVGYCLGGMKYDDCLLCYELADIEASIAG